MWPEGGFKSRIKCRVSIGTGVPSLSPFKDDIRGIGGILVAISTETEATAESFRRDYDDFARENKYFRFNVDRGLDKIALEDSQQRPTIVAATRHHTQMPLPF